MIILNVPSAATTFPGCALVYAEHGTGWRFVQAFVSTALPKLKTSDNLLEASVERHVLRVALFRGLISVRSSTDAPQATVLFDLDNGALRRVKAIPYPPELPYDGELLAAAALLTATPSITVNLAGSRLYDFSSANDKRTGTLTNPHEEVLDNGQTLLLVYLYPTPNESSFHGVSLVYSYVNGAWVDVPLPPAPAGQDEQADARSGQLEVADRYGDASGSYESKTTYEVDGTALTPVQRSQRFEPPGYGTF